MKRVRGYTETQVRYVIGQAEHLAGGTYFVIQPRAYMNPNDFSMIIFHFRSQDNKTFVFGSPFWSGIISLFKAYFRGLFLTTWSKLWPRPAQDNIQQ